MTSHYAHRASERNAEAKDPIPQPESHGAATPVPIPSEPEPLPSVIPLPDTAPKPPEPQPEIPRQAPHTANAGRWSALFFLPNESPDEFDAFYERLDNLYMPYNDEETVIVAKFAEARWALNRRKRVVERIEEALYQARPNPVDWSEEDFKRLARADAYRERGEKAARRLQKDVESFMRERNSDSKWQSKHDLAERHLQLQRQRFSFTMHQAGVGLKQATA